MAKKDLEELKPVLGLVSFQLHTEDTSFEGYSLPFCPRYMTAYLNFTGLFSNVNYLKSPKHQASVV